MTKLKPLLLKVVGHEVKKKTKKGDGESMRIFPRYPGHYSLINKEGKWTLNKIGKDDSHWIFVKPLYVRTLLAGENISVDEDILSLEIEK